MADIDSFLVKCTLESIEDGVSPEEIQTKCEYEMGFKHHETEETNINSNNI